MNYPRLMLRDLAASYLSLPAAIFDQMILDGELPRPKSIYGLSLWDRLQIDAFADRLASDAAADVSLAQVAQYGTDEPPPIEGSDAEYDEWSARICNSPILPSELAALKYMRQFERHASLAGSKEVSAEVRHRLLARGLLERTLAGRDWPVVRLTASGRALAEQQP